MSDSILKEKKLMFCPFCGEEHYIEERVSFTTSYYNYKRGIYKEYFYLCTKTQKEFVNGKMLNENILNMKKAFSHINS